MKKKNALVALIFLIADANNAFTIIKQKNMDA